MSSPRHVASTLFTERKISRKEITCRFCVATPTERQWRLFQSSSVFFACLFWKQIEAFLCFRPYPLPCIQLGQGVTSLPVRPMVARLRSTLAKKGIRFLATQLYQSYTTLVRTARVLPYRKMGQGFLQQEIKRLMPITGATIPQPLATQKSMLLNRGGEFELPRKKNLIE